MERRTVFLITLFFWCEGVPLCIDTFSNIISDPRIPQKAKSAENIEKYFPDCAGHKIREIKWDMFKFNSDGKIHNEELICICLDNGKRILFPAYFRGKINEQRYSYFGVI